ncbi:putative fimbrial usher protein StbD [Yersinia nurmii]|uniref:Fimbrial usher protein StbD n=2 Tax=Yersinia nurmii TaxID=685706 RepID=A0ABP1YBQ9_9GAMM|nr:putative fimbrial usher protein StbD [Yersinia nurmii]
MLRPTKQLIPCEVSRPMSTACYRRPRILAGVIILIGLSSSSAWSACSKITSQNQLGAGDGTAGSWAGSLDNNNGSLGLPGIIDLSTNANFQPDGTLLAAATSNFTTFALNTGYDPERVLFRCDAADVDQIFEMYATNGDNDYAGKNEDGTIAGNVPSGFATYVRNVVIRITNLSTGEYYSRLWKGRRLTDLDTDSSGRILVKAKNFSNIYTELFRIDYARSGTNNSASYTYAYTQPNAYIAFKGPGINGPIEGTDSVSNWPGWYGTWPASIGLYNYVTFRRTTICAVTNFTPTVILPRISVAELNSGGTSSAEFNVDFQCQTGITSGVTSGAVAMGFLVPAANAAQAQALGLMNGSGGISHLVSDNYGASGTASGVGIRIYRNNNPINLLSKNVTLTGNSGGWYGIFDGAQQTTGSVTGGNSYTENFRAELGKISGQTVTPGAVNAHAQVVIRVQ